MTKQTTEAPNFSNLCPISTKERKKDEVPTGWTWGRLNEVARLESGHTPSRKIARYWDGGDVPWLSLKDIRGLSSAYVTNTVDMPTQEGIANSSARMLPKDTVAFCRTASVGNVAILGKEMATSQDFVNWVCSKKLDAKYLYWALKSSKREFDHEKQGATHKTIYMPAVKRFNVLLPPLAEQKQIANILDKAEAIRSKRRVAIELVEKTLRSAFLDLFGDPVINPHNWTTVPISHFVSKLAGGKNINPASEDDRTKHYVLKVSAVTWGEYRANECKPLPSDYIPPESHFVQQGDLLISRANTRELIGATAFIRETPSNVVLPDKIWRFVWNSDVKVSPLFVHFLFAHRGIQLEIGRRASGSSGSMKNIAKPKLLSIQVPFPDFKVQQQFDEIVRKVWSLGDHQKTGTLDTKNLFNSLVQRAFKGEL